MRSFFSRRLLALALALAATACARPGPTEIDEQAHVQNTFEAFKSALFARHAAEAVGYLDTATLSYLASAATGTPAETDSDADVKKLLHGVAEKLTPGGVGPNFTVAVPLQRFLDEGFMNTHDLESIGLGPVAVAGDRARAEVLFKGGHTTYQLAFVREGEAWKVDLLGALPYAVLGLRMDRTMKNETEQHQLDRLVAGVPVPEN